MGLADAPLEIQFSIVLAALPAVPGPFQGAGVVGPGDAAGVMRGSPVLANFLLGWLFKERESSLLRRGIARRGGGREMGTLELWYMT